MKKPTQEWRWICPHFGARGHSTHVHDGIKTLARAQELADAEDDHYRAISKNDDPDKYSFRREEIGCKVETRTITAWEEVK